MTAPRPTGSIDIWNFVDNVTGTTVRKWLRDSWARRKIASLQIEKQDALSATQLEACNSGINATQLQSILDRLHALDGQ